MITALSSRIRLYPYTEAAAATAKTTIAHTPGDYKVARSQLVTALD